MHFAFDNLDFNDDTNKDHGKTLHATTHIIYQYPKDENDKQKS